VVGQSTNDARGENTSQRGINTEMTQGDKSIIYRQDGQAAVRKDFDES